MKKIPWLFGSLAMIALAACNGNKGNDNGSAAGAGSESGSMQSGATSRTDTGMAAMDTAGGGMSGMSSDTATGGARMHSDTTNGTGASSTGGASTGAAAGAGATGASSMRSGTTGTSGSANTGTAATGSSKGNQTKSGVTNTKTGKSTLGKGVLKTRPDQGQPVTAKGDTVASSPDSSSSNR